MGNKEIVIGIEKRFANLQITKSVSKFIQDKKGKREGKIQYVNSKYTQDETNNYYTFTIETEMPLENAAEYVRKTIENIVKKAKVIPFVSSSKELTNESNVLRFAQFKSKYIDKIES